MKGIVTCANRMMSTNNGSKITAHWLKAKDKVNTHMQPGDTTPNRPGIAETKPTSRGKKDKQQKHS